MFHEIMFEYLLSISFCVAENLEEVKRTQNKLYFSYFLLIESNLAAVTMIRYNVKIKN